MKPKPIIRPAPLPTFTPLPPQVEVNSTSSSDKHLLTPEQAISQIDAQIYKREISPAIEVKLQQTKRIIDRFPLKEKIKFRYYHVPSGHIIKEGTGTIKAYKYYSRNNHHWHMVLENTYDVLRSGTVVKQQEDTYNLSIDPKTYKGNSQHYSLLIVPNNNGLEMFMNCTGNPQIKESNPDWRKHIGHKIFKLVEIEKIT